MDLELKQKLRGRTLECWKQLLFSAGLEPEEDGEKTVLLWDGEVLAAAGSRKGNLFKCIAVREDYQGRDLTSTVLTALRQDAFQAGYRSLFLYTKPKNLVLFQNLFFYPVAQTRDVLLMESTQNGIRKFVEGLPAVPGQGKIGAVVMNCNPFTRGHRYLVETAAAQCSHLYVFVLSEDRSDFSSVQRMDMVKLGTADLANVTVLPTGPYLISSATFPTYFLKERDQVTSIHCMLDIEVFVRYFVPKFGITHRFVGTEPFSQMTNRYNEALKKALPERGITLVEIPRLEFQDTPISASSVRRLIGEHRLEHLSDLVPDTTRNYLQKEGLL